MQQLLLTIYIYHRLSDRFQQCKIKLSVYVLLVVLYPLLPIDFGDVGKIDSVMLHDESGNLFQLIRFQPRQFVR